MQSMNNKPIASFNDLKVYQNTYNAAIKVIKELLLKLPNCEKYDLTDQLRRSTKAIPRLIAEGYGKRHQKAGFQKYLDDAVSECNETIVGLNQCQDIYSIECNALISIYEISAKQIYRLAEVWTTFKRDRAQHPDPASNIKPAS